jgi:hypothetical protein
MIGGRTSCRGASGTSWGRGSCGRGTLTLASSRRGYGAEGSASASVKVAVAAGFGDSIDGVGIAPGRFGASSTAVIAGFLRHGAARSRLHLPQEGRFVVRRPREENEVLVRQYLDCPHILRGDAAGSVEREQSERELVAPALPCI